MSLRTITAKEVEIPFHVVGDTPVGELLARAATGDRAAWEAIVEKYHRLVWSVIRSYRMDEATAADVFQTVWERLVTHVDRIREPNRLSAWLATTAKHEALRVLGQQRRLVPSEFADDLTDRTAESFEELMIDDETAKSAFRAFRRLPADSQHLLRLLCTDPPLDYQAIAEIVGRPVGSIGPTRARILEKLRQLVADESKEGTEPR